MTSEIRIFVPVAIRALLDDLTPRLEVAAGASLTKLVDLNPRIPERIAAGEDFDIGLTNPPYAEALCSSGHADGRTHRPFGRVPLAVGRKAGSDAPIRRSVDDITDLFRNAKTIAYTGAGTSGRTYLEALARLGLNDAITSKSRPMGGGEPVASVAAGETELAVAPLTTVLSSPGVTPAAIFPEQCEAHIDMSVFLSPNSRPGAAAVLDLLTEPWLDTELAAAGVMRFTFHR